MEQGSCAGAVMEALVQLRSSPLRTAEAWAETVWLESWPPPSGRRGARNTVWLLYWLAGHRAEGFHSGLSLSELCGGGSLKEYLIEYKVRRICFAGISLSINIVCCPAIHLWYGYRSFPENTL